MRPSAQVDRPDCPGPLVNLAVIWSHTEADLSRQVRIQAGICLIGYAPGSWENRLDFTVSRPIGPADETRSTAGPVMVACGMALSGRTPGINILPIPRCEETPMRKIFSEAIATMGPHLTMDGVAKRPRAVSNHPRPFVKVDPD